MSTPPPEKEDGTYALGRQPRRFYISRRFSDESDEEALRPMRFAYQVFDADEQVVAESEDGWEVLLRETATVRQQLKALFFEDDRGIPRIWFQRFSRDGRPVKRESFSLHGAEVEELMALLYLVKRGGNALLSENKDGLRLSTEAMRELLEDSPDVGEDLRTLFADNKDLLRVIAESGVLPIEVIEYGNRKEAVRRFRRLLDDEDVTEKNWQEFFEENHWILGAGLAPQFLHSFRPDRLEQTIIGASIGQHGRRADAVMRTAGRISALVFVEIKRHTTALLAKQATGYRKGAWKVSGEVSGGVAQCQSTVHSVADLAAGSRELRDWFDDGTEAAWAARVCRPRSLLVVGSLAEFERDGRLMPEKYESFERFRRSLTDPEIVTFDELYERAALWLEMSKGREMEAESPPEWDSPPIESLKPPPEYDDEGPPPYLELGPVPEPDEAPF